MRGSLLTQTWVLSKLRLQTDELIESTEESLVDWKLNWVFWLSIIRVRLTVFKCLHFRSGRHHKRLFAYQSWLHDSKVLMDDG